MRILNVFLAVLVSVTIGVLVFEGGLRLFPDLRPQPTINRFDPELGWSKRPDDRVHHSSSEFGVTFATDAHGLRDDTPIDKPAGTFRVLMLGDSFVLGYTVDREDLFVDRLEQLWRAEGRNVDVVNAGTEGWSTDQEVLWFLRDGEAWKPDMVVLFPYENDIYWNAAERYTRFPKPRFQADGTPEQRTLADPGPSGWLGKTAIGKFYGSVLLRGAFGLLRGLGLVGPPAGHFQPPGTDAWVPNEFAPLMVEPPAFLDEALARTRGALLALRERCASLGVPLVMVPIPSESAIQEDEREKFQETVMDGVPADAWSPDRPVEIFLDLAQDLGIPSIDLRRDLRSAAEDGGRPLYFAKEWHFNPHGNEVFASLLAERFDRLGAFPEDHQARVEATLGQVDDDTSRVPGWLKLYGLLCLVLGTAFSITYRDEKPLLAFLKVAGMLAAVFAVFLGVKALLGVVPPHGRSWVVLAFLVVVLGFVAWKLGRRIGTITELLKAFTLRGHWYLMPLVVVLLSIGSLLVVAASSPLIAPFIYTLF